ncbi:disrupted in renal carcinoma protein 2 homolog [Plakobranchus ocellatus]|uniref:Disrupted in renal carcinoma protein 2 homolog n=1 Tax=Plakobranchus ocellatus TaxID=259542 RepID=A0AAV4CH01_9GAST|nr:disrupted in renal carcinoma protein 2 homolog [Plakobranchus ocellatus]
MAILYSTEFAAAAVLFILVIIYFPSKPPLPPSISASVPREEYLDGLKHLIHNKQFWVTAIAYSVPIGVYEVWQVVLDVILDPKVSQQTAGWMDFYATIGGCISGLLISRFADLFTRQMKVFLLVFYFLAAASMLWFSLLVAGVLPFDVGMAYAAMVIGGVFLDGGAPLFFELVIEVSYPVGEGVTSGCLQMICAGAGVVFLSLVQIQSIGKDWMNWLFTACITLAIPLLFFIKTNYGRADIDDMEIDVSGESSSSEEGEDDGDKA